MERDDQVRRLSADVEILQAHVAAMDATVTCFAQDLKTLTTLMVALSEHVNTLAVELAEARNR